MKFYIKIALSCLILSGIVQSADNHTFSPTTLSALPKCIQNIMKTVDPDIDKTDHPSNNVTNDSKEPYSMPPKWTYKYNDIRDNNQKNLDNIKTRDILKTICMTTEILTATANIPKEQSSSNLFFARIGQYITKPKLSKHKQNIADKYQQYNMPENHINVDALEKYLGISQAQREHIKYVVNNAPNIPFQDLVKSINEYPIYTQRKFIQNVNNTYKDSVDTYAQAMLFEKNVECGKKIAFFTSATLAGLAGLGYMYSKKK